MILKYILFWILDVIFWFLGMLLAPILPAFRILQEGPSDNNNKIEYAPYLPDWLFWFSTNYDNSLWGDHGWRTKHCVDCWNTYWGMVKWLWRNCASGFSWSVLAYSVSEDEEFEVFHSGHGLNIDKSIDNDGWFKVVSKKTGAWQFRSVKIIGKIKFTFESGWLLDVYVKHSEAKKNHPKAAFLMAFPLLRLTKN